MYKYPEADTNVKLQENNGLREWQVISIANNLIHKDLLIIGRPTYENEHDTDHLHNHTTPPQCVRLQIQDAC